ncbi:hypothetical protein VNO77_13939 [Canavalia gladiata]|uniref:Uncharacterized protein n=1 Tax=Canavalia gladiata TaxID=3824 RepID=A0AAN9M1E9_CANGL
MIMENLSLKFCLMSVYLCKLGQFAVSFGMILVAGFLGHIGVSTIDNAELIAIKFVFLQLDIKEFICL